MIDRLICCCLISLLVFTTVETKSQWNNLKFKHINTKTGLSQNTIQCILEDDLGFLWFGTKDGINRYDSYRFYVTRKDPQVENTLFSNDIKAITQDKDKKIWVSSLESGSVRIINPITADIFDAQIYNPDQVNLSNIVAIVPTKNGNLLLCSRASGLLIFDHASKKIKRTAIQESITSAVEDVNGTIWLGTINKGIIHVTKNGKVISRYNNLNNNQKLPPVKVTQLFIDQKNTLWIGTYGVGLFQFDQVKKCLTPVRRQSTDFDSGSKFILSLGEDITGQIWVGTENSGLYILNSRENKTYAYKHDDQDQNTLGSNSINVIKKDRKGNMWLGTSNSGIAMVNIDDVNILHYRHSKDPSSINNNTINAIFEDSQRNIWIGTDGGGINIFNKRSGNFSNNTQIPFKQIADGSYVLSINEDNHGNIWIGTWSNGLYIVNLQKKTIQNINTQNTPEFKSNSVMAILKDKHEQIWVGTYGGGISVFNTEKQSWTNFRSNSTNNSINSNHVLCLFEDKNDNILIGTESGGLNIFDPKIGQFKILNTQSALKGHKLTNNNIITIDEDQNGNIWVGTAYGLNRIHLQTSTNRAYLTSNSDLLSDVVRAVITDLFGDIWIATTKGVSRLQTSSNTFTNYTVSTGLQDDEFRNGKLLDKDGDIYFGGKNGFNILDPKNKRSSTFIPSLVFSNFELNNAPVPVSSATLQTPLKQSITYTDKITLDYDQNSIAFEFATLNYIDPEIKKYKYKLEGLDKDWHSLNLKNYISFANIPPGNYTLLIKGLDNNSKWSSNYAKMDIVINPPWWLTWWFKTALILLISLSIIGLYFNRVKNIRNKNKILEEKIALKTDQLFLANNELRKNNEDTLTKNLILEQKNKEIENINNKITEQQKKILDQNNHLEIVVQELEKNNEMKDKFFSILAHDLRNPISAISGLTDLLKSNIDQLSKQELEDYIDDLVLSSHSVNNLLINLLEWGKSKSNKLFFKPTAFSLFEVVKKNIYLFNIAIQEKNIDIVVNIQSDEHVYADYQMMSTIIRNILNNSIKFSHKNGKINFDATISEDITIKIKDNGVGMTPKQVKDIFSNQTKPTKGTSGETGTGLGFQICREFISAHHGELHIQSEPGVGTEFIIRIPIVKIVDTVKIPNSDLAYDETTVLPNFEKKKILIIDDNKVLRNLIRRSLEKNFSVEEAENGIEGLAMATSVQPDLIISDLIMPQMDGISLCKILKSKVETSHIPVLMLTGEQDEEQQILGYNAGADIYLTKPFNNKLLHTVIHNFLSKQVTVQKKIFSTPPDALERNDISTVDKDFLATINQFILENLNDYELDYRKISNHVSVSRSVLYAKFKTLTGQGVHDYIKNIRLVESLKLLKERKLTISQIAYAVGFNSISYYSKSFSKEMKMSPKQYQKEKHHEK